MPEPALTVEASTRGIDRLVIEVDRGDRINGFVLLQRVFPALLELDRRSREPESPEVAQG